MEHLKIKKTLELMYMSGCISTRMLPHNEEEVPTRTEIRYAPHKKYGTLQKNADTEKQNAEAPASRPH